MDKGGEAAKGSHGWGGVGDGRIVDANPRGAVEMKVIRDDLGNVMATFDSWQETVNAAYMSGAKSPAHIVSDGTWR